MSTNETLQQTAGDPESSHAGTLAVNDATFATVIERAAGIALVDFGADWCPPCRLMAPIVDGIAAQYAGRAIVAAVDVDESQRITASYGVRSFPTFLFFRDGQVVDRVVGAVPKSMLEAKFKQHA